MITEEPWHKEPWQNRGKGDVKAESKEVTVKSEIADLMCSSGSSILHKDFRIIGKIGPEDMPFAEAMAQIQDGERKKYGDAEIVSGVLRSISSKTLRSYLALIKDVDLKKLKDVLRVHYQQKTATELYQDLIAMRQELEKKEEPSSFLMRCLKTREEIIFAAGNSTDVQYTDEMVQGVFLRSLESGLQVDVVNKIRQLTNKKVTDVELIEGVSQAESMLKMREQKTSKKSVKVSAVAEEEVNETLKVMKEMKNELSVLKKDIDHMKNNRSDYRNDYPKSRYPAKRFSKCKSCEEKQVTRCNHCYRCGEGDHLARDCTKSGNGHRLFHQGQK